MYLYGKCGNEEPATEADPRGEHGLSRATVFHPFPKNGRGDSEHHQGDLVGKLDSGNVRAEFNGEGFVEDAEAVYLPDAHVDSNC